VRAGRGRAVLQVERFLDGPVGTGEPLSYCARIRDGADHASPLNTGVRARAVETAEAPPEAVAVAVELLVAAGRERHGDRAVLRAPRTAGAGRIRGTAGALARNITESHMDCTHRHSYSHTVERDPLAIGLAIMTVHLGRREDSRAEARTGIDDERAPATPLDALPDLGDDLGEPERPLHELDGDERAVADGKLILDLIGHDATSEDVGELIVALGMLGAILAEEAAAASGRPAAEIIREVALRYVA
jgi:hypothetical protein